MKSYSKETYLRFQPERQVKICLDSIYFLEKNKNLPNRGDENWKRCFSYLTWLGESSLEQKLRIRHLLPSLQENFSLRKLLNMAIALERFLGLSVKDESFLVTKDDGVGPTAKLRPIRVVLHNLRSAFNVGSIFRTAECLGVSHIFLAGYTPTPEERPVQKTAMGAQELVPWTSVDHIEDIVAQFKSEKIQMVALETSKTSKNIFESSVEPQAALFFGNERFGLDPSVLAQMDQILEIPMWGKKNSLNVSNAFAISASEILRSWSGG